MLETIKKKSRKAVCLRTVLCVGIIIAIMWITKFAPIKAVLGPEPLNMAKDMSGQAGRYVEYDLNLVLGSYVEEVSVDSKTRRERVTSLGYLVSDYDTGITFAMTVKNDDLSVIKEMEEDTFAWLDGDGSRLSEMKVRGTLVPLTGEKLRYFNKTIREMGFEDLSYVKAYSLEMNRVGEYDTFWALLFLFVSLLLAVFAVCTIVSHIRTKGLGKIKKYLENHPGISMESLQDDFESAVKAGGDIWIGKDYTFYMSGFQARLFKNTEAVWAYYYKRTGRNSISQVQVYLADKSVHNLNIAETLYPQIIECYQRNQPHMVLGYSKELQKLYEKNFDEFLNIRYRTAGYEGDAAVTQEAPDEPEGGSGDI